jgi:hypothetical protein
MVYYSFHPAAFLELKETMRRPANLFTVFKLAFLLADSQQHHPRFRRIELGR